MPSAFEHGPSITIPASPAANSVAAWSAANNLGATIAMNAANLSGAIADDDIVLIYDTSTTSLKTVAKSVFVAGIGGTTVNGTTDNAILTYINSSGEFTAEANLLYSSSVLTLNSSNVTTAQLIVHGYGDASTDGPGRISIRRSRTSTIGGNGAVTSGGDNIGIIEFAANDGDSVELGAAIRVNSTENWSNSARGNRMRIFTTANGSTSQVEAMRIDQNAEVTVKENNTLASVTKGIAKAWIKNVADVSGGSSSGQDSYNITVSENGTGDRVYTFGDDFENAHYVAVGSAYGPAGSNLQAPIFGQNTLAVGSIDCLMRSSGGGNVDVPNSAAFFGEAT